MDARGKFGEHERSVKAAKKVQILSENGEKQRQNTHD